MERSVIPDKYKIFSGSMLKILALASMITDHAAAFILYNIDFFTGPFISLGSHSISIYKILRLIGRLAFPIYCFLLVEGFEHTRDRKKYGINLLTFALISEIPWNLIHSGTWHCSSQNVFFTLFLGFAGMYAVKYFENDKKKMAICLLGLFGLSVLLKCDYGCSGYSFIIMMYMMRNEPLFRAVIGSGFLSSRWKAGLAFIPITLYNGKRGFIKGKAAKYAFYVIYPLHFLILYFIKQMI